jgi:hypothetical protein
MPRPVLWLLGLTNDFQAHCRKVFQLSLMQLTRRQERPFCTRGVSWCWEVDKVAKCGGISRSDLESPLGVIFVDLTMSEQSLGPPHRYRIAATVGFVARRSARENSEIQSKPGGGTKPTISFSARRLKAIAVLSRPLAAIAWYPTGSPDLVRPAGPTVEGR